jgi:hypothetical protein
MKDDEDFIPPPLPTDGFLPRGVNRQATILDGFVKSAQRAVAALWEIDPGELLDHSIETEVAAAVKAADDLRKFLTDLYRAERKRTD